FLIVGAVGAVLFCLFVIVAITLGVYFYRRAELQAISWIIDWSDLEFPDKKTATKQSLLDDLDTSDTPFTGPVAADAPPTNVDGQTVSFGDIPTSPIAVGSGNEQMFCVSNEVAPHKPPRRSIFHKASSSSSGDIAGSGNVGVTPSSHPVVDKRKAVNTSISLHNSDEPAAQEVVEEASLPYSTVRRFQQRWVRRHRLSEDNSSASPNLSEHANANTTMLNHRAGTKPQTEPIYYHEKSLFRLLVNHCETAVPGCSKENRRWGGKFSFVLELMLLRYWRRIPEDAKRIHKCLVTVPNYLLMDSQPNCTEPWPCTRVVRCFSDRFGGKIVLSPTKKQQWRLTK
ncbi:hypothetical protein AHF37_02037, partial [Paragonimus kellicotti]